MVTVMECRILYCTCISKSCTLACENQIVFISDYAATNGHHHLKLLHHILTGVVGWWLGFPPVSVSQCKYHAGAFPVVWFTHDLQHLMGLLLIIFTLLYFFPVFMSNSLFQCGAPLCKCSFDSSRGLWGHHSCCLLYQEHCASWSDGPCKCSWSSVLRTSKKARVEFNDVGCQKMKYSNIHSWYYSRI